MSVWVGSSILSSILFSFRLSLHCCFVVSVLQCLFGCSGFLGSVRAVSIAFHASETGLQCCTHTSGQYHFSSYHHAFFTSSAFLPLCLLFHFLLFYLFFVAFLCLLFHASTSSPSVSSVKSFSFLFLFFSFSLSFLLHFFLAFSFFASVRNPCLPVLLPVCGLLPLCHLFSVSLFFLFLLPFLIAFCRNLCLHVLMLVYHLLLSWMWGMKHLSFSLSSSVIIIISWCPMFFVSFAFPFCLSILLL